MINNWSASNKAL